MEKEKKDFSVFIASSSKQLNRVKAFMRSIQNNDFKLIHDWTIQIYNEENMNQKEIDKSMISDLDAVREADIFIFYQYSNETVSIGANIELGAALLLNKPIFILNQTTDMCDNVSDLLGHSYLDIKNGRTIYHSSSYIELMQNLAIFINDINNLENDSCKAVYEKAIQNTAKSLNTNKKSISDSSPEFINELIRNTLHTNEVNLFKAIEKDLHKQTNYKKTLHHNYNGDVISNNLLDVCDEIVYGEKFDTDKLRWDLLPIECVEEIIKTYMLGVEKYAEWNWTKVEPPIRRWWNAANRHLSKIRKGEIRNSEDGNVYHAAQAAWNCIAILYHHMNGVKWADNKISNKESVKQSTEQTSKKS